MGAILDSIAPDPADGGIHSALAGSWPGYLDRNHEAPPECVPRMEAGVTHERRSEMSQRSGKAVRYDRFGTFDVVQIVPIERPSAAPGEIVVEVSAAGLNHIERFLREGRLRDRIDVPLPAGQGVDFAGVVVGVGEGAKRFKVGDEVLGHAPEAGSHATWLRVPETAAIRKPARLPLEVAGGLYLAGCTAVEVVEGLRLGRDDTVVISAAAGGVGHIEAQLARRAGAHVIALGSLGNHDFLRQIGAHPVVYGDGEEERIRDAAEGRTITAFIDNHGESGADALARRLGVPAERFASSPDRLEIELRLLRARADDSAIEDRLTRLAALVADRQIVVLVSGFYPFDLITEAYKDLAEMHSRGKVVVGMHVVEDGERQSWYLSEKARTRHERLESAAG